MVKKIPPNNVPAKLLALVAILTVAVRAQPTCATIFEDFQFGGEAGTPIPSVVNSSNPSNFFDTDSGTGGDANVDVATNGLGQLNASLKNNVFLGTNFVDTVAHMTGTIYGVLELTWDFQSTLNPAENEQIRLGLINVDPRGTEISAEIEIERTDTDEVTVTGQAGGAGSSDLIGTVLNGGSLVQNMTFIGVVAADLDDSTYEIFYSTDAGNSFLSAGIANSSPGRIVESMRLTLNNDLTNDNILIDRIYLTDVNPVLAIDKLTLQVNTTTGVAAIVNDSGTSFDIDRYRIESSTDALNFATWNSLSDQLVDAIDGPDADSIVGNGVGETWDEAGGSDDGVLSESFLLGSSALDPNDAISIGHAFQVGGAELLAFEYRDAVTGNLFPGEIEFVTDASADFDLDGDVDGKDFLTWQRRLELGGQVNNSNGDADGSHTVDAADLAVWQNQFGSDVSPVESSSAVAAVPEPTGCRLMVLALFALRRVGNRTAT